MRSVSLKFVPTAILSRQTAGIRGNSLIVNLPGKPSAIDDCLNAVFPAIPYCIDLIDGAYLESNPEQCRYSVRLTPNPGRQETNNCWPYFCFSWWQAAHAGGQPTSPPSPIEDLRWTRSSTVRARPDDQVNTVDGSSGKSRPRYARVHLMICIFPPTSPIPAR